MAPFPQRVSVFKRGGIDSALDYAGDGERHWRSTGVGIKPEARRNLSLSLCVLRAGSVCSRGLAYSQMHEVLSKAWA